MSKRAWSKIEHELWRSLKASGLERSSFLVACSGGADSVALLHLFRHVLGRERVKVAHFHHGAAADAAVRQHRDHARAFVRELCQNHGHEFYDEVYDSTKTLSSEADFRRERYRFLLKLVAEGVASVVATAHHLQDVTETRLIRLLRGTGPQGLRAIETRRDPFFRPLLTTPPKDLQVFLDKHRFEFVTDPSNSREDYLRNWVRNVWLPQLSEKRPGSVERLGRSFDSLVEALGDSRKEIHPTTVVSRARFSAWTESAQKRWLARALLAVGAKNFTQNHLQEILKRTARATKTADFRVAGCSWHISAQQIKVQKS